jgi:ANTAR domain/GAF domain
MDIHVRHEQLLAEAFVGLAVGLSGRRDVSELQDCLVAACVHSLGEADAGLLMVDLNGAIVVASSSSERVRRVEEVQRDRIAGPGLDCIRSGASVVSEDLELELARWPEFTRAARSAGFCSALSVPVQPGAETIGALTLYGLPDAPILEHTHRLARAFADVVGAGIVQTRDADRSAIVVEQLQHAVDGRIVIEQAKGVLAERHALSMDAAFGVLRRFARDQNYKLTDVAIGVICGEAEPAPAGLLRHGAVPPHR